MAYLKIIIPFVIGFLAASLTAWIMMSRRFRLQDEKRRKLLQRAKRAERLAELGALTGHLTHEIRNPLSIIKVNLQLLSENISSIAQEAKHADPDNEQLDLLYQRQLRKLETITKETDRLTDTLNDFMRFAGQMELHLNKLDLNEILDDLIDFYDPQAVIHNIKIRYSLDKTPATCNIDKDLIKQAILNLFINATQVMDEGGELLIRTEVTEDRVRLEIADTGPGIPDDQQEKIFDPYYTTRTGGTGLGLPMCRRIFEEHQGHIELQSEVGKGTSFMIDLPLAK